MASYIQGNHELKSSHIQLIMQVYVLLQGWIFLSNHVVIHKVSKLSCKDHSNALENNTSWPFLWGITCFLKSLPLFKTIAYTLLWKAPKILLQHTWNNLVFEHVKASRIFNVHQILEILIFPNNNKLNVKLWSCVLCIYVSPRIKFLLLNFLYAISILAFWLGSARYIPLLLKTLSVTVHFMPMSIAFWLPTARLIRSFWPSYQRYRNDNKCNPNEKAIFPHLIYLQRLSTFCVKHPHFPKAILICLPWWILCISEQQRIWKPALGWYIIKTDINSFPPKSNPLLLLRFSTSLASHMTDLSER